MSQTTPTLSLMISGQNDTRIWGLSNTERLRRLADKAGVAREDEASDTVIWTDQSYAFDPLWFTYVRDNAGLVVIDGDKPVLAHVNRADADTLANGNVPAGAKIIQLADKPQLYNSQLRKLENPFFEPLTPASAASIERKSYYGA